MAGRPRNGITTLVFFARSRGTSTWGIGRSAAARSTLKTAVSVSSASSAASRSSSAREGGRQSPTRLVRASEWLSQVV